MSEYISFYIKSNKGDYSLISSFSRNSIVYKYLEGAFNYGIGYALTEELLGSAMKEIKHKIEDTRFFRDKEEEKKNFIAIFKNSVDEKLKALEAIDEKLYEFDDEIDELKRANDFLYLVCDIIKTVKYRSDYNYLDYVYAGIEWNPAY